VTAAIAAIAAIVMFGSAACSSSGSDEPTTTSEAETTTTAVDESTTTEGEGGDTSTTEADDDGGETGSAGEAGETAEWAKPFDVTGELLTTIEAPSFTVDVYQVGTAKAPKDGNFVDPDTNQPLIQEGDELVFVNYVFTNTSDAVIPLSFSLVSMDAEYADWPWMQGMDGITDSDLAEEMKIVTTANAPGGDAPFAWEPGTSFAYGENFEYQAGSAITFEARMTPSDDEGELVHDEKETASAETKIN
jgi:hypothetical protein